MALAETTISSAVAINDKSIVVASATSFAPGRLVQIGEEFMQVTKEYVSGTTIPVLRGRQGGLQVAHVASSRVVHGNADDFGVSAGQNVGSPLFGRTRRVTNVSASSTLALPASAGEDLVVILNGTAINTVTVPVPTKDLDLCTITFINSAAAAHVITFTGGLSGAGSSYDVITLNATGQVAFSVMACNEVWVALGAIPLAGTVTNVTGTLS